MVTGVFPALPGRQLEPVSTNKKCRMKSRKASKNVFLSLRSQLGSSRGKKTRRWSRSRSTTTFHHRKYRLNVFFFAPIPAFRNRNRFASWRGGGSPNGLLRFKYCSLQWANRQMVLSNGRFHSRFHSRFHYKNYSRKSALEVSKYGRSIVGLAKISESERFAQWFDPA